MSIDDLSEKHAKECAYAAHDKIGLYPQDQMWVFNVAKSSIRNALTEQAETHALELRAYETTVAELQRRVEAQSVAVVGDAVAWRYTPGQFTAGGSISSLDGMQGAIMRGYEVQSLVVRPTHSITAAELATLREKAAEADELRKALQKACIGLAHASEANPLYQKNYEACEKALMAIAQEKGE